ncbi:OsmC family peroxiredoxin [Janibacter alittae]|uniref:OsmC family peroxiredoxin n=1 Tax=Janibacter alittae TaxID=3115209 RepID=A0ABZ2MH03_9MICO
MSIADRSVTTTWEGPLATGRGTLHDSSSGVLDDQLVTWGSRTEAPGGRSSPEELLAAAHSSCFSQALALTLDENKTPPSRLDVSSTISLEEVDGTPTITTSTITVRAVVDGIDEEAFGSIVESASALCPVSRLFTGATITVDAALVSA